jgi:magnesium chelatase subunit D
MKLALILNVVDPSIGGVLMMGHRGTGKSTAVRALADLLPPIKRVRGCLYGCDPLETASLCAACRAQLEAVGKLPVERSVVPVVDLPLGATEDRVCGTINIERALTEGLKAFEPGLLARANRGFLYIDEVNLLEDHLVDLLLDASVTGRNLVEREGISIEHPARLVLIGSGNPEEGELRPQLLDRFGLHVQVETEMDLDQRVQIVLSREAFERDPAAFLSGASAEQTVLRRRISRASAGLQRVRMPPALLRRIAELCLRLKVDGHRGELTISRAARALAAFEGRREVAAEDVRRVAALALRHRLRRDPLEQTASTARIEQALDQLFPTAESFQETKRESGGPSGKGSSSSNSPGETQGRQSNQEHESGAVSRKHAQQQSTETRIAPAPLDARLPDETLYPSPRAQVVSKQKPHTSRRSKDARTNIYDTKRGRYTRSVVKRTNEARVALDATLRVMAQRIGLEREINWTRPILNPRSPTLRPSDLRYRQFKRKRGRLFIFAIDTSGSMALNRIAQARGALESLLRRSYIRRDRVALISFREAGAEVLLEPSRSVMRAQALLTGLRIGGATPLPAGVLSALTLARRAARQGTEQTVLLLFTDGRANVPLSADALCERSVRLHLIRQELELLGRLLQREAVSTLVVDTQRLFTSGGEGRELAEKLCGQYLYLPSHETKGLDQSALWLAAHNGH